MHPTVRRPPKASYPRRHGLSFMRGRTVSHYNIIKEIGSGSMGVVFKAQDLRLGRLVALKFLSSDLSFEAEAKERFAHEATAASALDHPNICAIHEISESETGQVFIAMAYYDGETLEEKLKRGPLPLPKVQDFAIQTASGLASWAYQIPRSVSPCLAYRRCSASARTRPESSRPPSSSCCPPPPFHPPRRRLHTDSCRPA